MERLEFELRPETPGDLAALRALSADAFGPGRFARTAYRVREAGRPVPELCLTGWREGRLAGAIRFTAVTIGGAGGALLLGPLVVDPAYLGKGCGRALIAEGLARARAAGCRLVVLVGDLDYYARAGFQPVPPGRIAFPGPVDPARILAAELQEGALSEYAGRLAPAQDTGPIGLRGTT